MTTNRIVYAAIAAWLVVAVISLVTGPPLGHDEAAYAVAARGDAPAWLYRSSGMIAVARAGVALGGSAWALRGVALVLGAGVVVATFAAGRAAFDARTGAWSAAVIATAHQLGARSAELIGDLPATACLLGGTALVVGELDRDAGPRWRLVAAAPLLAAAFYIRYGSAPVIAIIAGAAAVLWWRRLATLPVAATVVAFALCLVPHVVHSIDVTGSPLGILRAASSMPASKHVGDGLLTYLTSNPLRYFGVLVAPLMLAGLASLVRPAPRWRPHVFVVVVALGQLFALGLHVVAQPRYVFFATVLLAIAGVDVVRRYAASSRSPVGLAAGSRVAAGAIAVAWLGLAIGIVPYNRWLADKRAPLYAAAEAVRADAHGRTCTVAANVIPQLMWITRCDAVVAKTARTLPSGLVYVVSAPHAVVAIAPVAGVAGAVPRELAVASDQAQAWRLDRP
jgi:hypothetical protein